MFSVYLKETIAYEKKTHSIFTPFANLTFTFNSPTGGFLTFSLFRNHQNKKPPEWQSLPWKKMYFPNPLAPAGGVDKSAKHIKAWWSLGAGFIEVGTITPLPQKKTQAPRLKETIKSRLSGTT